MTSPAPLKTVLRKIDARRQAVRLSGNAAVEASWGALEDYVMRIAQAGCEVEAENVKSPRLLFTTSDPSPL